MDEIFHVPQAQKYCNYKFDEWDPKITTLPGLYFISFACLRTLAFFVGHELRVVCSTFFLRMVNTLFLMGNVLLLRQILLILHCDNTRQSRQVWFSNFMNSVKYSGTFLRNHFVRYQNTYVMERGAVGSESLTSIESWTFTSEIPCRPFDLWSESHLISPYNNHRVITPE